MSRFIENSIGHKLLKIVFSYYFVVTVIVTSIHLYHEYISTKESVISQLYNIGHSFEDGLKTSLWSLDYETMNSILTGITKIDIVSGVKITDKNGKLETMKGNYVERDQNIEVSKILNVGDIKANEVIIDIEGTSKEFYEYVLPIEHTTDQNNSKELIGFLHIYSPSDSVMSGYKKSVSLIIFNAILKTCALWIIFLYFSKIMLSKPLLDLSEATFSFSGKNSKPKSLDSVKKMAESARKDEIQRLSSNFLSMHQNIMEKIANLKVINHLAFSYSKSHQYHKALENTFVSVVDIFGFEDAIVFDENKNMIWNSRHLRGKNKIGQIDLNKFYDSQMNLLSAKGEITYQRFTCSNSEEICKSEIWPSFLYVPISTEANEFFEMWFLGTLNRGHIDEDENVARESIELLEVIANLLCVNLTRIRQSDIINESKSNLEIIVSERTASLQEKTNDILCMMQNMHQGIFTVMNGGIVHHEYAAYLEDILETKNIAGRNFIDLLFTDSNLGSNAIDQVYAAVSLMMQEDAIVFNFNSHLLVTEYVKEMKSGKKFIELDWDPIIFDGVIEKIMVTVRDVTQVKALQIQTQNQKRELEIIGQILNVDREGFVSFLKSSFNFIDECRSIIQQTDKNDTSVVSLLFRNMHTVKGNARTYGFSYITDSIHDVEQSYDELRKNANAVWNKTDLLTELKTAEDDIKQYQNIFTDKLGFEIETFDGYHAMTIIRKDIDELLSKFDNMASIDTSSLPPQIVSCLKESYYTIAKIKTKQLGEIVSQQINSLSSLSKDLGKPIPQVTIRADGLFIKQEAWECLKNVFTHLLRNSIDHGIESVDERLAKGKRAYGKITIDILDQEESLKLCIKDDGRGLALAKLRKIAEGQGLLSANSLSNQGIAELIFNSGISCAETTSVISGRGVGMEASRKFLEKIGGTINLELALISKDQNPEFAPFHIIIELPKNMYLMAPRFAQTA